MKKVKGAILCGGKGKRLRPLTYYFQKTMIPIGRKQKPLLEYIVKLLKYYGITDLVLLVGYKHEQIINYFENGERFGVKISYIVDVPEYQGTGGALLNAYLNKAFSDVETVLVYYGDILSNINLADLLNKHWEWNASATLAVAAKYQIPVGVAETRGNKVVGMREKPWLPIQATIGILALNTSTLKVLEELGKKMKNIDIMGNLIPELIRRNHPVYAYQHSGEWYDVGTTERYEKLDNSKIDEMFKHIV